jgi:hypothetical protein
VSRNLTPAEVEQRRRAPVLHGADSPAQIVRVARAQKRRWLRQAGLRAGDLDGIALALLDNWSRAQSKVELCDRWYAEHGFLDEHGEPHGPSKLYFTAMNCARLAATRLAEHVKARGLGETSMVVALQAARATRDGEAS